MTHTNEIKKLLKAKTRIENKLKELDQRIEHWLLETFGIDLDFEVDDALGKLDRLGLLRRDGAKLSVPAPDKTLARLDYIWDNFFQYNNAEAEKAAEQV